MILGIECMFLTLAKLANGSFVEIDEYKTKEVLYCPFCGELVVAKQGKVRQHHFAHKGETCEQSSLVSKSIFLPMVDSLDFLDGDLRKYLFKRYQYKHSKIYSEVRNNNAVLGTLEAMGLIAIQSEATREYQRVVESLKAIDESLITGDRLSHKMREILSAIEPISKLTYHAKLSVETEFTREFQKVIKHGSLLGEYMYSKGKSIGVIPFTSKTANEQYFCIQAARKRVQHVSPENEPMFDIKLKAIEAQALYVMGFHGVIDGFPERFIKVGRTGRELTQRLDEVKKDLLSKGGVLYGAWVLDSIPGLGRMEKIAHWHLKEFALQRNEYFALPPDDLDEFLFRFDNLKEKPPR